jgi:hypothetical protein
MLATAGAEDRLVALVAESPRGPRQATVWRGWRTERPMTKRRTSTTPATKPPMCANQATPPVASATLLVNALSPLKSCIRNQMPIRNMAGTRSGMKKMMGTSATIVARG